jgi:uncharacterized protein (TIGR01615 family)
MHRVTAVDIPPTEQDSAKKEFSDSIWENISLFFQELDGVVDDRALCEMVAFCLWKQGLHVELVSSESKYMTGRHYYLEIFRTHADRASQSSLILDPTFLSLLTVARPSDDYSALLDQLPSIFLGSRSELFRILKTLVAPALKISFASKGMDLPPWRRFTGLSSIWGLEYKKDAFPTVQSQLERFETMDADPDSPRHIKRCRELFREFNYAKLDQVALQIVSELALPPPNSNSNRDRSQKAEGPKNHSKQATCCLEQERRFEDEISCFSQEILMDESYFFH